MQTITINNNKTADQNTDQNPFRETLTPGEAFYQDWLENLCGQVPGVYAALLAVHSNDLNIFQPAAIWPQALPDNDLFAELVERAVDERGGLVTLLPSQPDSTEQCYGLAYPVQVEDELAAIVVLALAVTDKSQLQPIMKQVEWHSGWIELPQLRSQLNGARVRCQHLQGSVELFSRVLPEDNFDTAAMRLITELAGLMNCNLVSIGRQKKRSAQICHISFSAEFGKKMNLVRAIEAAMDESIDQLKPVVYPEAEEQETVVSLSHKSLSELQCDESIMTVPLFLDDKCWGAITLHRDGDNPFQQADIDYCEALVALSSAVLEEKRLNSRSLFAKITDASREQLKRLFGAGYYTRKLVLLCCTVLVVLMATVQGDYRLASDAVLESFTKRMIVAPYDGYINKAPVRGGDTVAQGDLLVQLDDRDLKLEQLKWQSQKTQLARQYQDAIAKHDRAGASIVSARIEQSNAQLEMVKVQMARGRQTATLDGRIISGDLSQRLGGSVTKGEILFEISPLSAYRVSLKVRESRIGDVQIGQTGTLFLSALPEQPFPFTVNRVTPFTDSRDGASFFTVEAELEGDITGLQPGMEGIGKIEVDRRLLVSVWTREMMDWLRLQRWRWLG